MRKKLFIRRSICVGGLFALFILISSKSFGDNFHWNQKAEFPPIARHRCVAFSIGNKGYCGTGHINAGGSTIAYSDFWEFDPATNTWTQKANFGGGNRFGAVGFSIGNRGYIGTGNSPNYILTNDFWEYNPVSNTWIQKLTLPASVREGAIGFGFNGFGYLGGGNGTDWWQFNPISNTWISKAPMPASVQYGASFVLSGIFYVATGMFSQSTFAYDPVLNSWSIKANFPGPMRFGAFGFGVSGKGYIGAGCDYGYNDFRDLYQYSPDSNQWIQIPDFPGAKRHYICGFAIGNKGYCGTGTNGTNLKDFWEFYYLAPDTSQHVLVENVFDENKFFVFPNPTSDELRITNYKLRTGDVLKIFNLSGQLVFEEKITSIEDPTFNIQHLVHGIYVLQLTDAKNTVIGLSKFIKQ